MRSALQAVVFFLSLALASCGDSDGDGGQSSDGRRWCDRTCERFKSCIQNLKDSPGQLWVCRCEDNGPLWASAGSCIEACALKSSCDDLWAYFTHTLSNSVHLYLTSFHACQESCR
jgi:hypothetical protein